MRKRMIHGVRRFVDRLGGDIRTRQSHGVFTELASSRDVEVTDAQLEELKTLLEALCDALGE